MKTKLLLSVLFIAWCNVCHAQYHSEDWPEFDTQPVLYFEETDMLNFPQLRSRGNMKVYVSNDGIQYPGITIDIRNVSIVYGVDFGFYAYAALGSDVTFMEYLQCWKGNDGSFAVIHDHLSNAACCMKLVVKASDDTWNEKIFSGIRALEQAFLAGHLTNRTEIEEGLFRDCYNLKYVNFNMHFESIDHDAFLNCPALEIIRFEKMPPDPNNMKQMFNSNWYETDHRKYPNLKAIVVPDNYKDQWGGRDFDQEFGDKVCKAVKDGHTKIITESEWKGKKVKGVSFSVTSADIKVFSTYQLTAALNPSNAWNKGITYTSSDPSVASVSQTGLITAHKKGTAKITATTAEYGLTASFTANVIASLTLSLPVTGLDVGANCQSTVKLNNNSIPENVTVSYSSSSPSIAAVSSNGNVTALKPGRVTITAAIPAWENCTASCTVFAGNYCGDSVTWTFADSILTLTGTGATWDFIDHFNVQWEANVVERPWYSFKDEIRSVIVSEGITVLGICAFQSCTSLQSVSLPQSLTSIKNYAFERCSSLPDIIIPDNVTSLGSGILSRCENLKTVELGTGVRSLPPYIFMGSLLLSRLILNSPTVAESAYSAFMYIDVNKIELIVPDGLIERYKNSPFWLDFNIVKIKCNDTYWTLEDSVLIITGTGPMCDYNIIANRVPWFDFIPLIKRVVIEDGITTIGNHAFYDCNALTSINLGNSITTIGNHAFYDCEGLKTLTLPAGLDSIGNSTFSFCVNLDTVTSLNPVPPALHQRTFAAVNLNNVLLYVPQTAVNTYKNTAIWQDFNIYTYVTGISLNEHALHMRPNRDTTLTVTVSPSNASSKNTVWSSSNPALATVTQDGTVHIHPSTVDALVYIKVEAEDNSIMNGNIKDSCALYITPSREANINEAHIYYKPTLTSLRSETDGYDLIIKSLPASKIIEVEDKVRHVKLEFKPVDCAATIEQPAEMYLTAGDNKFTVTVTAEAGNKMTHYINIIRQDFHPEDLIYTYTWINDKAKTVQQKDSLPWERDIQNKDIILPYSTTKTTVKVNPTFDYIESTVIDSVDVFTEPVRHDIILTNNYDREKRYTIQLQKALNPHSLLHTLNVADRQIEPRFNPNIYSYKLNVDEFTDKLTINTKPISPATVSGPTGEQSLNEGNNHFIFTVTGETGNTATYTLDVYREYSDTDILVLGIAVNPDAYLNPPFNSNITDYTTTVDENIEEVMIDIGLQSPLATFGSDYNLPGIYKINHGNNLFRFLVLAENKDYSKLYSVNVIRLSTTEIKSLSTNEPWINITDNTIEVYSEAEEWLKVYTIPGSHILSLKKPKGPWKFPVPPVSKTVLIIKAESGWVRKITV